MRGRGTGTGIGAEAESEIGEETETGPMTMIVTEITDESVTGTGTALGIVSSAGK